VSSVDLQALALTLRLAFTTMVVLIALATPLAWWLAHTRSHWRAPVEALTTMPLVLPPTVLGFYLLVLLGPLGPLGRIWEAVGGPRLVFSFWGLLIGSLVYSLPFAVQPLRNAFAAIGDRPFELAATLRAAPLDRFFTVALPLSWPGFLTAATLTFANTVGEFGVVLMIGGNIPNRTQVLSIALFNHVEMLEYRAAHRLAAGLLVFSFAVLLIVYALNARREVRVF
jgi:molybdate transport system permease protein